MQFETIVTEIDECIMLITLNRHKTLNALNQKMAEEIISALREADKNEEVGCIIITGSEKAFAAGADIKEMREHSFSEILVETNATHCMMILDNENDVQTCVDFRDFILLCF